jgi:tRNA(Ile)-lysidine synthase
MMQKRFDDNINPLLSEITEAASYGVALAVSGGSDSIALLHLATEWAKSRKIRLVIFSVNHNLRPESSKEIEFVRMVVAQFSHEFYELSWDSGGNKVAIQARARAARYNMMSEKCRELGINTMLTAHHLDDRLETYLMHKNKKNGILGLSYSNSFFYNNVHVFRPLSSFLKSELLDYLNNSNIKWIEDESNALGIYERNRIRLDISTLTEDKKSALFVEMREANEEAHELNERLISAIAEAVSINKFGFAIIDLTKIRDKCFDIQIYVINYVLTIIGGKDYLPRFRSTKRIINKLETMQKIDNSLHGCILKQTKDKLLILREYSEINSNPIQLNDRTSWDDRFIIESDKSGYSVGRLALREYIQKRDQFDLTELSLVVGNNHKHILFTLPVIKSLEKIVAIPHISYYDETQLEGALEVIFRPNFISRFTHFL